jgi:hypothetical protein
MEPLDSNLISTGSTGLLSDILTSIDSKFMEPVRRQYKNLDITLTDNKTTYTTVAPSYGIDVMSIYIDDYLYPVGTPVNIENLVELLNELDIGWFYINDSDNLEVVGFHEYGNILNDSSTVRFTAGSPTTQANVPTVTDIIREISLKINLGSAGNAWKLDGNTVTSAKGLGTLDAYDLPIIVSGDEVARFFTTGELGINTSLASGARLNVVGTSNVNNVKTLRVGSSDGSTSFEIRNSGNFYRNGSFYSFGSDASLNNTSWGADALNKDVTGTRNSLFGGNSGKAITTGNKISGFGYNSASDATTASSLSAFGNGAAQHVVDADFCSYFGDQCGNDNISADNNSGFGYKALDIAISASNSAFGSEASLLIYEGVGNSSFGALAGAYFNTTSANTTSLGRQSGLRDTATSVTNSTYVGSRTVSEGSNEAVFGGRNVTNIYFGVGKFAQGTDLGDVYLSIHSPASGSSFYDTESSNHAGVDLYIDFSRGLGSGNPGKGYIRHSAPTTSGTTLQTLQTTAIWSYDDLIFNPYSTGAGNTFALKFKELAANGTNTIAVKAPDSITSTYNIVLPGTAPSANYYLKSDASGNTSWADINTFKDNLFIIQDNSDNTKQLQFQLSGIPTATTRILTISEDVTLVNEPIFDYYANVSVGGAETDIFTDTLTASKLGSNGDKIFASYSGNFVTVGTELTQLKVYFGGTAIWDSTAIAPATGTTSWRVFVEIIRVSGTKIRYSVSLNTTSALGFVYETCGELTGLTLSNTNVLKITGTSSGVGSGAGDIVGVMGYGLFKKAV